MALAAGTETEQPEGEELPSDGVTPEDEPIGPMRKEAEEPLDTELNLVLDEPDRPHRLRVSASTQVPPRALGYVPVLAPGPLVGTAVLSRFAARRRKKQ